MTKQPDSSTAALWARFRFSVVGSLLSSPPARGELQAALQALAAKTWTHPVNGRQVHFCPVTIERWYYKSRQKDDPIQVLRRAVRKDCGKVSLTGPLIQQLAQQYDAHPHWTYQLHFDNLAAAVKAHPGLKWSSMVVVLLERGLGRHDVTVPVTVCGSSARKRESGHERNRGAMRVVDATFSGRVRAAP